MPKVSSRAVPPADHSNGEAKPKKVKPQKAAPIVPADQREVKYPEITVEAYVGESAITVVQMKEILGWEEETEQVKFGNAYMFEYRRVPSNPNSKVKVRLTNNITNRPIYWNLIDALKQEHLQRRWRFNGEPIIVGKTAQVLNGQHTLISGVMAEAERCDPKRGMHWEANWPTPVTIEKLVVFGVEENDETINTMDTCKPRSIADVIYRSPYFTKLKDGERRKASRYLDYAVRLLWDRTGVKLDAFAPCRTSSEAIDFIERHQKLLKCVRHIMTEDKGASGEKPPIGRWFRQGYSAAMMYLMACSGTVVPDDSHYYEFGESDALCEKSLNFDHMSKAEDFWRLMKDDIEFMGLRNALRGSAFSGDLPYEEEEDSTFIAKASVDEKISVIAKAWSKYLNGEKIREKDLKLEYVQGEDSMELKTKDGVGGIDLMNPRRRDHSATKEEETKEEETKESKEEKKEKMKQALKDAQERRKADKEAKKADAKEVKDKIKGKTRKQIEAEQTAKAKEADEAAAKAKKGKTQRIAVGMESNPFPSVVTPKRTV
jgi:hypothetical protein